MLRDSTTSRIALKRNAKESPVVWKKKMSDTNIKPHEKLRLSGTGKHMGKLKRPYLL